MKEPTWIDSRDAVALHDRLIALEGGPEGLRDAPGLESALARPRHLLAYEDDVDTFQLAAAYIVGIVRNHPFIDGNKRTGFSIGVLFLEINGYNFVASEEAATQVIFNVAAGELTEEGLVTWMRENSSRHL